MHMRDGLVWCGVVWCGVVWCGVVWCGVVWCGVVWCGVVWCVCRYYPDTLWDKNDVLTVDSGGFLACQFGSYEIDCPEFAVSATATPTPTPTPTPSPLGPAPADGHSGNLRNGSVIDGSIATIGQRAT
jgi:hypothetical protein